MKLALAASLLLVLMACGGGGGGSTTPVTPKTYGIFRQNRGSSVVTSDRVALTSGGTINMSTPRVAHTSTLLPDGRVLLAGGSDQYEYQPSKGGIASGPLASMDLFDPATESFTPAPGALIQRRVGHAAVMLENGRVLFIGGGPTYHINTLETYDPATGQSMDCGSATEGPFQDNLLIDAVAYNVGGGRILVLGSNAVTFATPTSPILLDSGTFSPGATNLGTLLPLPKSVFAAASCQLADGRVLISGGSWSEPLVNGCSFTHSCADIWVFNPATSTFSSIGAMNHQRSQHSMVPLPDGKVAIIGGQDWWGNVDRATGTMQGSGYNGVKTAEIFDPATGASQDVGAMSGTKYMAGALLLQNGMILDSGGASATQGNGQSWRAGITSSQMVFGPSNAISGYTANMVCPRVYFAMTMLPNGLILVSGGEDAQAAPLATAEIYDPLDQIYLTYPNPALPYGGSETLTVAPAPKAAITGASTWSAALGAVTPAADGLTCAYTYPAAPAKVQGQPDPAPIAFDTVTFSCHLAGASTPITVTATISLAQ